MEMRWFATVDISAKAQDTYAGPEVVQGMNMCLLKRQCSLQASTVQAQTRPNPSMVRGDDPENEVTQS